LRRQVECGFQFTQNIEGMFKDMAYSDTLMDAFKKAAVKAISSRVEGGEKNKDDIDVDVKVLSPNNWPLNFPPPTCTLPPFAAEAFARYEQ